MPYGMEETYFGQPPKFWLSLKKVYMENPSFSYQDLFEKYVILEAKVDFYESQLD